MNRVSIRQATLFDLHAISRLLESASLPTVGVEDHLRNFLVAEIDNMIVGAIGLEVYYDTGLLRSAVVTTEQQNQGIGTLLYQREIDQARNLGIRRLLLLTNTAENYFSRKGFTRIDQNTVAGPIMQSVEFSGACPSHAACMELIL